MIKFDENNVGMEPIKAGEYEVYANAFDIGFSQAGNERVQFNYFIREDVQQPSQGSEIRFDNFTNTPNAAWRMNSLMKALGFQNGTEFPDMLTWAKTMLGRPLRVKVEMEANDNGKEYARVKQLKASQFPQMQQQPVIKMDQQQQSRANQFNQPNQASYGQPNINYQAQTNNFDEGRPINISEDDLPF